MKNTKSAKQMNSSKISKSGRTLKPGKLSKSEKKSTEKKDNYIYSYIRKISVRLGIVHAIALCVIIALMVIIPFNQIFSPHEMLFVEDAASEYKSGNEYVEVTLNGLKYTGYDLIRHKEVYGSYYYSLVDDKATFVLVRKGISELPEEINNYTVRAKLVELDDEDTAMLKKFAKDLNWNYKGLMMVSSQIIVDETEYNASVYYYLFAILILIMVYCIARIVLQIIYYIFPWFHGSVRMFSRLTGGRKGIEYVCREMEQEILLESGNIILTKNYFVSISRYNIEMVPVRKVIWVYQHSTWNRFFSLREKYIYTLNLYCDHGITVESSRNTGEDVSLVINYIKDKYENIIVGYSKENKNLAEETEEERSGSYKG